MPEEAAEVSSNPENDNALAAQTATERQESLFSISYLLDASWATFKNIWLALLKVQLAGLLLGILASAAAVILFVVVATAASMQGQGNHSILTPILIALGVIVFVTGALILGSWVQLKQLHVLAAKEEPLWSFDWPAIWGLIGVTVLTTLAIIGGFILLIIPGILFAIWLSQSQFVYVFEGIAGKAALLRSKDYVSGRWWQVFGRLMLPSLAVYALSAVATAFTSMLRIFIDPVTCEVIGTAIQIIINIGGSLFILCYSYHLYLGLKATTNKPSPQPEVAAT